MTPEKKFKILVKFVQECGITVKTGTRARGHQGFFMKNRIDVSNVLDIERKIEVLVHEFAHYAHYCIESGVARHHGSLETLFKTQNAAEIKKELLEVTKFIDKNTVLQRLNDMKIQEKAQIKAFEDKIKSKYPDFKRSEPYKKFDAALKRTDAKYFLKYDRVKVKTPFTTKAKTYCLKDFLADFPQFDEYFEAYINLKSHQRLQKRISAKINRLNKYYSRPSELFARFAEGIYIDKEMVQKLAPQSLEIFFELLNDGYYGKLKELFELCGLLAPKRLNMNRDRRITEPFFDC